MERADKLTALASARFHELHPPVTAGVGKYTKPSILTPSRDQRSIRDRKCQIVPRLSEVADSARADPTPGKKVLLLKSQDVLIDVAGGRKRKGLLGWAEHSGKI